MEDQFAQDAGEVAAKFVVASEAAQMQNHAVKLGQFCFQIKSIVVGFHVQFLSFPFGFSF